MTVAEGGTTNGWEEHRREQVIATAKATPAQLLRWLEEAIAFAVSAGALPRRADQDR